MRIAIVDDEDLFRRQIAKIISSLYGDGDISCYHYSDGKELVATFENGFPLDAVFLDIEMKDMDGMLTARLIRKYSKDIPVIFLTSHTEMAIEGYEVGAFRFLAKPVDPVKFKETLTDLEKLLKKDEKIVLHKDGEDLVFPVSSLVYAEACNNSVRFVFTDTELTVRMKFSEVLKMIESVSRDFCRTHRSYIISLMHVTKMTLACAKMDNGEEIPVSRSYSRDAKTLLFDYVRRQGR